MRARPRSRTGAAALVHGEGPTIERLRAAIELPQFVHGWFLRV